MEKEKQTICDDPCVKYEVCNGKWQTVGLKWILAVKGLFFFDKNNRGTLAIIPTHMHNFAAAFGVD